MKTYSLFESHLAIQIWTVMLNISKIQNKYVWQTAPLFKNIVTEHAVTSPWIYPSTLISNVRFVEEGWVLLGKTNCEAIIIAA